MMSTCKWNKKPSPYQFEEHWFSSDHKGLSTSGPFNTYMCNWLEILIAAAIPWTVSSRMDTAFPKKSQISESQTRQSLCR